MSKPDLVKDTTRAIRLLGRVARGEMTFIDLLGGLGKGADAEVRATSDDDKCTKNDACTAANGHEGGCVFDVTPENSPTDTDATGGVSPSHE